MYDAEDRQKVEGQLLQPFSLSGFFKTPPIPKQEKNRRFPDIAAPLKELTGEDSEELSRVLLVLKGLNEFFGTGRVL